MNKIIFTNKGFSLERLRLLCDVARAGGIRAAVGEDPVRQSLASRQLKELSEYANVDLTQRVGRGLELTEAGIELATIGEEFFSKMTAFLQRTNNLPHSFKLGVGDSLFQWQILPRMRQFANTFKTTRLISYSYSSSDIIKAVELRRLDAGIIRERNLSDHDLVTKHIGEIRYKLFVPIQLIPNPTQTHLPQISKIPFCTLTGEGEYAKTTERFLSTFNGTTSLVCSSMTQMFAAVQSEQYAAILPENAEADTNPASIKSFTLPELSAFTRPIALIFKPNTNASAEKSSIIDFLTTCI